ncbi:MAG: hypothetical protein KAR20_00535 [Candidatus Heimdallarchaeota archaeon]|nr:hypothetical protein [Candidatus Heimdallarchaeota archaeon]
MSNVSRSVYQKVKEENKRLESDMRSLILGDQDERKTIFKKWLEKFRYEAVMHETIKAACKTYMKNNPNDPAVIGAKEIERKFNESEQ